METHQSQTVDQDRILEGECRRRRELLLAPWTMKNLHQTFSGGWMKLSRRISVLRLLLLLLLSLVAVEAAAHSRISSRIAGIGPWSMWSINHALSHMPRRSQKAPSQKQKEATPNSSTDRHTAAESFANVEGRQTYLSDRRIRKREISLPPSVVS